MCEKCKPDPEPRHRFSGWPGAYCLDCGMADEREYCLAVHEHAVIDRSDWTMHCVCANSPCAKPGARQFDLSLGIP